MTAFLTFTLYAPIASWGDEAVGEVRSSWDRPSRSAILGLLAAALGLTREAEEEHRALDVMLGVAVRIASSGRPFVDYHTAMDPTGVTMRRSRPRTRKIALEAGAPDTALTRRSLRQDSLYSVALWSRAEGRWSLEELEAALGAPTFVLYAGRKANALGLPLGASVREFDSIADALATIPSMPPEVHRLMPRGGWGREVAFDVPDSVASGFPNDGGQTLRRRDDSPHRIRWQFEERSVRVAQLPPDGNHE